MPCGRAACLCGGRVGERQRARAALSMLEVVDITASLDRLQEALQGVARLTETEQAQAAQVQALEQRLAAAAEALREALRRPARAPAGPKGDSSDSESDSDDACEVLGSIMEANGQSNY